MSKVRTLNRSNLVGEWKLDGNALDSSGNGYNGTATNVTYVSTDRGYQSQAGSFNGSNAYVKGTSGAGSDSGNTFSLSCWVKTTATSGLMGIYNNYDGSVNLELSIGRAGTTYGQVVFGDLSPLTNSSTLVNDGKWHHIVATRTDGGSQKIYIDGTLENTTGLGVYSKVNGSNMVIGSYEFVPSFPFNGQIQSFRIYNTAIDQNEIQSLYLEGLRRLSGTSLTPLIDGLVAYWDFNGDANDVVGGRNGSVTNASLTTDYLSSSNHAYSFNGTNTYILGSAIAGNVYTFEILVNLSSGGSLETIMDYGTSLGSARYYGLYRMDASTLRVAKADQGVSWGEYVDISLSNGLHHIVAVFNNTSLTLFIDGSQVGGTTTVSGTNCSADAYSFGARYGNDNNRYNFLNGVINYIRIYNRALSASEILALYQLSSQRYLTPLLY